MRLPVTKCLQAALEARNTNLKIRFFCRLMEEVEKWSRHEGMAEKFERIKPLLKPVT